MKITNTLETFPVGQSPVVLTIGNFDGVHRGHQQVLQRLRLKAQELDAQQVVITFSNHPSLILRPNQPVPLICTLQHRIKLLAEQNVDNLLLLEFTKEFSLQTAEQFLRKVKEYVPFSFLLLGHDAVMGRDRQGDREHIKELSKELNFDVEYLDELTFEDTNLSSSAIREEIKSGNLLKVEKLLGRPYSVYGKVARGRQAGKKLGFPTANIDVKGLCLPPLGVYAVTMENLKGVANLGIAPTMRSDNVPVLEVHLLNSDSNLDLDLDLYDKEVETVLRGYIRPEQKFESPEALIMQIGKDVDTARIMLSSD